MSWAPTGQNWVFLDSLRSLNPYPDTINIEELENELSFKNQYNINNNNSIAKINELIATITRIATAEQAKENAAINYYFEKRIIPIITELNIIKNSYPEDSTIEYYLNLLNNINNKKNNLQPEELIAGINAIMQDFNSLLGHLEEIEENIPTQSTLRYSVESELEQFWIIQSQYSAILRNFFTQYIEQSENGLQKPQISPLFATDIDILIEDEYKKFINQVKDEIAPEIIKGLIYVDFLTYLRRYSNIPRTLNSLYFAFQQYINDISVRQTQLQQILHELQQLDKSQQKILERAKAALKRATKALTSTTSAGYYGPSTDKVENTLAFRSEAIRKAEEQYYANKKFYELLYSNKEDNTKKEKKMKETKVSPLAFTWRPHNKSDQGYFAEDMRSILVNALAVDANIGADRIIIIGELIATLDLKVIDEINNLQSAMSTQFTTKEQRRLYHTYDTETGKREKTIQLTRGKNSIQNEGKRLTKANREIIKKLKAQLDPRQKLFIAHETDKLYRDSPNKTSIEMHGRSINILTALAKMNTDTPFSQIDPFSLIPYFLNLKEKVTINSEDNQEPLERYLTLFAGMLMFDDLGSMVQDSLLKTTTLSAHQVQQIHIYNLNGTFVPLSVLLFNLVSNIQNATTFFNNSFQTGNKLFPIAQISQKPIQANQAKNVIYTTNKDYKDYATGAKAAQAAWQNLADDVIASTVLHIIMRTGFEDTFTQMMTGKF